MIILNDILADDAGGHGENLDHYGLVAWLVSGVACEADVAGVIVWAEIDV
jgi:hypothetical protein